MTEAAQAASLRPRPLRALLQALYVVILVALASAAWRTRSWSR